jgi:hypothetical protein
MITRYDGVDDAVPIAGSSELGFLDAHASPAAIQVEPPSLGQGVPLVIHVA